MITIIPIDNDTEPHVEFRATNGVVQKKDGTCKHAWIHRDSAKHREAGNCTLGGAQSQAPISCVFRLIKTANDNSEYDWGIRQIVIYSPKYNSILRVDFYNLQDISKRK